MAIERRKIGSKKKSTPGSAPANLPPEQTVDADFDVAEHEHVVKAQAAPAKQATPVVDEQLAVAEELEAVEAPEGRNWKIAADIVNSFRPVPRLLWTMIHGVYGKAGEIGHPDAMTFSAIGPLLIRAAEDKTLGDGQRIGVKRSLEEAINEMGPDVAGSVCFVHSVCRRVSRALHERVSRPILDDALLRAHIGFYVGKYSRQLGPGAGMLAGFAGRCGLAIQIAWGNDAQRQKSLTGMASGQDMSEVCAKVYGCDPLEVAALALIAGGCSREIAFGVSAYHIRTKQVVAGSEQFLWLKLFSVIEHLRMGAAEKVPVEDWRDLGFDPASQAELLATVEKIQHRGHSWTWLTQPQL